MIRFNKAPDTNIKMSAHQAVFPKTLTFILVLALPGWASAAQPEDALNFAVGAALRYEDNLFRLDDDTDPRQVAGKSQRNDLITTTNIGIKFDKEYSQQRFQLDLMAIKNDYKNYDYLDFTAKNYRAAWLWHLTPDISGTLLIDRQQTLNNFADFRNFTNDLQTQQSIQTNEIRSFTADWRVGGGVHLLGGVSEIRSRNSTAFNAVGDYVQRGAEAGIKYIARSENSIALVHRESDGEYEGRELNAINQFNQFDTGFKQSETELQLLARLSGKSTIDARLGYLDREHDNFTSRDYDGFVGQAAYIWQPTGKLRVTTSLSRSMSTFQQLYNSYLVSDTFAISPSWQWSAKTTFRARYSYSERDYRGALPGSLVFVPEGEEREDKVNGLTLEALWQATRTILVTGTLQHERRSSNFDSFALDYEANSVGISGQLLF